MPHSAPVDGSAYCPARRLPKRPNRKITAALHRVHRKVVDCRRSQAATRGNSTPKSVCKATTSSTGRKPLEERIASHDGTGSELAQYPQRRRPFSSRGPSSLMLRQPFAHREIQLLSGPNTCCNNAGTHSTEPPI